MKHTKKITFSITIIFICIFTFFNGYNMVKDSIFSFADETTENWQNVTTNAELVEAFRYYCKSRDLTIEGSAADVITSFTTQTFNNVCNGLGIDMTALQAHLKKETDGSNIRYLFDSTGITAYNAIFAQFLQDNELEVGDSLPDNAQSNNTLYNGYLFTDDNGNSCLVTIISSNPDSNNVFTKSQVIQSGTPFLGKSSSTAYSYWNANKNSNGTAFDYVTFYKYGNKYTYDIFKNFSNRKYYLSYAYKGFSQVYFGESSTNYSETDFSLNGNYLSIILVQSSGNLYTGSYNPNDNVYVGQTIDNITSQTQPSAIVFLTTNNTVINNNFYEGDTIINNYGTPSEPSTPDPAPTPDYTPAEDWDIQLPDLDIPNWILSGKENKFPFDIPFNVMYALSLLQAEPQAPHLEGTMDFGFTTWEYDLDLSDFDTVAQICRNMEFLAFLTGLMLMTRKLIWG